MYNSTVNGWMLNSPLEAEEPLWPVVFCVALASGVAAPLFTETDVTRIFGTFCSISYKNWR